MTCHHIKESVRSTDGKWFGTRCLACGELVVGREDEFQQWKDVWHGPPKPPDGTVIA